MIFKLIDFYGDFFNMLRAKDLKTDEQLLKILDYYTSWDRSCGSLNVNVPDEIKDKFRNFLEEANVLVEDESYAAGYANMSTTNDLIDETFDYLEKEYDEEDFEETDIPSNVEEDVLYWVEPGIDPYEGGIDVNKTKFEHSLTFNEIKKIFELSDQDIIDIQEELDNAYDNPVQLIDN